MSVSFLQPKRKGESLAATHPTYDGSEKHAGFSFGHKVKCRLNFVRCGPTITIQTVGDNKTRAKLHRNKFRRPKLTRPSRACGTPHESAPAAALFRIEGNTNTSPAGQHERELPGAESFQHEIDEGAQLGRRAAIREINQVHRQGG